jgi:hypothetical protein
MIYVHCDHVGHVTMYFCMITDVSELHNASTVRVMTDEGINLLWNVGELPDYMAQDPRRQPSS